MVFSTRVVAAVLCLLVQPVPSIATAIEPVPQSESGIAPALLNTTLVERNNPFITRTDCAQGWDPCTNGVPGCCESSKICALLDGKPACCSVGELCANHTPPQCVDPGYALCPGVDDGFCCPQNDTCPKDASGNPTCASGPSGGVTVTTIWASTPFPQSTSPGYNGPGTTLGDTGNARTNTITGFLLFAMLSSMITILITI